MPSGFQGVLGDELMPSETVRYATGQMLFDLRQSAIRKAVIANTDHGIGGVLFTLGHKSFQAIAMIQHVAECQSD